MISNLSRLGWCLLLLVGWQTGSAQENVRLIREPLPGGPLYVIVANEDYYDQCDAWVHRHPQTVSCAVLLVRGEQMPAGRLADTLNHLMNREIRHAKERTHLVLVGDYGFARGYDQFTNDFFAAKYYLTSDSTSTTMEIHARIGKPEDLTDESFYQRTSKVRRFYHDITQIRRRHAETSYARAGKGGIGVGLRPNLYWSKNEDGDVRTSYLTEFAVQGFRQFTPRLRTRFDVGFSLNLPNPQSDIQEELQSQLDIQALLDGDDQEIRLQTEVDGHGFLQLGAQVEYEPWPEGRWRPFVGGGLSLTGYFGAQIKIDTTLVIEGGGGFPPAGLSGGFGGGDFDRSEFAGGENGPSITAGLAPTLSVGLRTELSPRWEFDTRLTGYRVAGLTNDSVLSGLKMEFNLIHRFVGRRKTTVPYVRLIQP